MYIIAHSFPETSHICSQHLTAPKEEYYELAACRFSDTVLSGVIPDNVSVRVSKSLCDYCNREYTVVEGNHVHCLFDESGCIVRGYSRSPETEHNIGFK